MKKWYDEVMGRIEMTDKMRERILERIQGMDIVDTPECSELKPSISRAR